MLGHNFYHGLTRRYVSYFGTLFNDIHIKRTIVGETDPSALIKVPLSYAPKKKILLRMEQAPEIDRPAAIVLPRMSFAITGLEYDGERNLPNLNRFVVPNTSNANKMKYMYVAAPYNITFELYLYVKNTEDATKIYEQFLPFFKPEWTASVQLIPEFGITQDIPIEMKGNSIEDSYEGAFTERQYLMYTFQFVMRAFYYGPSYDKPIIKFSNTNFYMATSSNNEILANTGDYVGSVRVSPGLDANGEPTSNASLSIDANEIFVDDDFGFVTEITGITLTED